MIQAIETVYNGYRFRSRLEARWAVFFDTLGVSYIYEREGFDLGDAGWYLPDFWLPEHDCWLEIKPQLPTTKEVAKVMALARHTNKLVFIFYDCIPSGIKHIGKENDAPDIICHYFGYYYAPNDEWDGMMAFGICESCQEVTLGHLGFHRIFCDPVYEIYKGTCKGVFFHRTTHPRLITAYTAARQARFEHGETPIVRRG